ncbi:hypothetical protein ACFE04_018582 [Oxalis oulophora]
MFLIITISIIGNNNRSGTSVGRVLRSHQESVEWSCESNEPENQVIVTIDGHADDWDEIEGLEFYLLPTHGPHTDHAYKHGQMTLKAFHDEHDVFFLLRVREYIRRWQCKPPRLQPSPSDPNLVVAAVFGPNENKK